MTPSGRPEPEDGSSPAGESERLGPILDMLVALASGDFERRVFVGDGTQLLDGIAVGLNMLAEELTRQRTFEEAMRARAIEGERLALVGQLTAGVAHEVNNPAAFVLANLTKLKESWPLDDTGGSSLGGGLTWPEALAMVNESVHGVERIVDIVAGLQTLAHRRAGPFSPVDVGAAIDDGVRLTRRLIETRARLVRRGRMLPTVMGDHSELVRVFTNLLINAAEAIPEGAAERHLVEVDCGVTDDHVLVSIRDTGGGIAVDHQHKIFQPFFSTKGRGVGSGLGLSSALEIISRHGGSLTFDSRVAQGATFRVGLPVAPATPAQPTHRSTPSGTAVPSRFRVLAIDDEELLLKSYQRFYGNQYALTLALGGAMAKDVVEQDQAWDAILCDLTMPDCDGPMFVDWLSARYPGLATRVIICSGGAFTPSAVTFLNRFKGPRLAKPFKRAQLQDALLAVTR